ncbi:oxaloacetate decarboxylase subunit gamma [uncultured Vibrio sp.]|uniref:oxaloacetate decarboxylase subunit gamma n=1 Tax=uncultured Vibrio sp. TaxID=114054 RepID=UPI00091ECFCB|nr:oxaloacetate decarboxylase subunit gamma [uncultured Vibrio sp.]OIQ24239.1 MAG: oxaloacetate decarboxylase subunit gamma [Vibrio sp. MedPE-SWchi]
MTNIGSLLGDAATLMMTGMTVVFIFLTILVYLVRLMSRLVPTEVPESFATPIQNNKVQSNPSAISPKVVAAISAAVHQHRTSTAK